MTTLSEHKFAELQRKLRELFELDKSDLDFGIYRIINARNREITAFLDRQLKDEVRRTLVEHGAQATDQVQQELDAAIEQATKLGVDPDAVPKVQELKAKLAEAGPTSMASLEADIYNHLLVFFSRYYDEGDFISRRRYKGDTYAIPYDGEEVTMYWANKDQYYIKSGEWHRDYRFKVGDCAVRFKVVAATQEPGNNKERDDAKRRFILDADDPIEASEQELVLRFQFRVPTDEDLRAVEEGEATRNFGSDYDKPKNPKRGAELEQFCAHAETLALPAMPPQWRTRVTISAATESKPGRTLLGKHLAEFAAKNTFDYFIHKDLGGFLSRELDFYIKNEVVRLDDLERLPPDHLARVQGRVKAIRRVAGRIIDLLAAIENFQKKMWLKKKFVLNTSWLITVDRLPPHLRDVVAANKAQWEEWERLGFRPEAEDEGLFGGATWGTREYLGHHPTLVADTRLFAPDVGPLLAGAAQETLPAGQSAGPATSGLLVRSDNFAALRLLGCSYSRRICVIYIDPPYNTPHSRILYKNAFLHSTWLSLLANSLPLIAGLVSHPFCFGLAIDDYEHVRAAMLLHAAFPSADHSTVVVNHHPQGSGGRLSRTHEYFLLVSDGDSPAYLGRATGDEAEDRVFMRSGTAENNFRAGRPNSFYALLYDKSRDCFVGTERPPAGPDYPRQDTEEGYIRIYPIDTDGRDRVWRNYYETGTERVRAGELMLSDKGVVKYRIEHENRREPLFSNWIGSEFNAGTHGTGVLDDLGLAGQFDYPKSLRQVELAITAQSFGSTDVTVLDYFAGSGTTAHACINLNRSDNGRRSFVLVEAGSHYSTVLRPRVVKALQAPDWRAGRPVSAGIGVSAVVKCIDLESYEDALASLATGTGGNDDLSALHLTDDTFRYSLDLDLGPHLLDLDAFRDPWGYTINAQLAGEPEIRRHSVDLVETFNYLIGLKVSAYGPWEQYSPEFERAEHPEGLGRLRVKGRLRRDPAGPIRFQRVEGELNDGRDTRVLVIWRTLTADPEQDAAVLDAWMARHREDTSERSEHRDHHLIYVNGPVTLPQPTESLRTVLSLEETFKARMFEDTGDL